MVLFLFTTAISSCALEIHLNVVYKHVNCYNTGLQRWYKKDYVSDSIKF